MHITMQVGAFLITMNHLPSVARADGPTCNKLFLLLMGAAGSPPLLHFFPEGTEVTYGKT